MKQNKTQVQSHILRHFKDRIRVYTMRFYYMINVRYNLNASATISKENDGVDNYFFLISNYYYCLLLLGMSYPRRK